MYFMFALLCFNYLSFTTIAFLLFSSQMVRHYHYKYLIDYKEKGLHKRFVKVWFYPVDLYNKLSNNRSTNIGSTLNEKYQFFNYYFLVFISDVLLMVSNLLNNLLGKLILRKYNNIESDNLNNSKLMMNMFNNFNKDMPKMLSAMNINNASLLSKIKKENQLKSPEDKILDDALNDIIKNDNLDAELHNMDKLIKEVNILNRNI